MVLTEKRSLSQHVNVHVSKCFLIPLIYGYHVLELYTLGKNFVWPIEKFGWKRINEFLFFKAKQQK